MTTIITLCISLSIYGTLSSVWTASCNAVTVAFFFSLYRKTNQINSIFFHLAYYLFYGYFSNSLQHRTLLLHTALFPPFSGSGVSHTFLQHD